MHTTDPHIAMKFKPWLGLLCFEIIEQFFFLFCYLFHHAMGHEVVWHVILAIEENNFIIIFIITYNDHTHWLWHLLLTPYLRTIQTNAHLLSYRADVSYSTRASLLEHHVNIYFTKFSDSITRRNMKCTILKIFLTFSGMLGNNCRSQFIG